MFEPEELMARIVDLEAQLKVSEMAPPAAEQLIACLEGEIAKRDARILELEAEVRRWVIRIQQRGSEMDDLSEELKVAHTNISRLDDLVLSLQCKVIERDAELAAIKAQEPVAEIALSDDGYKIGLLGALRNHRLPIGTKLYAAPVSEAKAQGGCDWALGYRGSKE